MFNIVINYLLERNVLDTKHYVFTIPKGAQGNLLISLACLINRGIRNLITIVPRAFLFTEKVEHLILVLLCNANIERKEIRAYDWLKPPISTLLTFFMFYIPDLALRYKKPIYDKYR